MLCSERFSVSVHSHMRSCTRCHIQVVELPDAEVGKRPSGDKESAQAVDAGTVMNPEQLRGQVEGGAAQAIGSSLYEEVVLDDTGRVTTDSFRAYRVPKISDVPRTEVLFASTHDPLGPLGAKSMSEAPYNPVAPAVANAVRDAIGVRPYRLPMTRDRVWALLQDGDR